MAAKLLPSRHFAIKIFAIVLSLDLITCLSLNDIEQQLDDEIEARKVRYVPDISLKTRSRVNVVKKDDIDRDRLDIYCYPGIPKKDLWRMWTSCMMRFSLLTDKYQVYAGPNASDVFRQHKDATMSWFFSMVPWRTESVSLAVFNRTCVGIITADNYKVALVQKAIDPWLVSFLVTGVVLFFMAKRLSRNMMFYYGTGVGFGLLASLLILVFILSRFMPKKYGAYAILIGGWSVTLWLIQYVWENIQKILEQYIQYVIGYFVAAGIISFGVLYYKGPVTNPRMINLIKWTLQSIALVLIYNSTQIKEVSATLMVIIIVLQVIKLPTLSPQTRTFCRARNLFAAVRWRWMPRLVPRPKLLTEEEYMNQGREETRRALEELREYCRSPDCDAWRTISRLNTPQRFAQWVEGSSHLSDQELYDFDSDPAPLNFEDDDNESEISFRLSSH